MFFQLRQMFSCCTGLLSETAWCPEDSSGNSRHFKRTAYSDNLSSAVWLHWRLKQCQQKQRSEKLAVDQFLLASTERPTKLKACWQEKFFDGPAARKDAEEALRNKWPQELESLLKGTGTPMGKILNTKAGD